MGENLVMEKRAYDNKYLHRDFHASIDNAIAYIGDVFGEDALSEYLRQYVNTRYQKMSLNELCDYFSDIYEKEEASDKIEINLTEDKLTVKITACPGLAYLNEHGGASKWYRFTTEVMYKYLADLCNFDFNLIEYDDKTGKTEFSFTKKESEK